MSTFELEQGETKIDTWTLLYVPPSGGKFNGKLTITNKRLIYEAQYDASILGTIAASSAYAPSSLGYSSFPKDDIENIETSKSFLSKKAIITMKNGEKHIFDYGMLNIDKVVAAMTSR